jgi:hypothetical protein
MKGGIMAIAELVMHNVNRRVIVTTMYWNVRMRCTLRPHGTWRLVVHARIGTNDSHLDDIKKFDIKI